MEVNGKADALLLLLRELRFLVGRTDALKTRLHVVQLILQRTNVHEGAAIHRTHGILDILCIARLARGLLKPLCDVVDDVIRRLAAVDHGDDLHLHLLFTPVRLCDEFRSVRHQMTFSPW